MPNLIKKSWTVSTMQFAKPDRQPRKLPAHCCCWYITKLTQLSSLMRRLEPLHNRASTFQNRQKMTSSFDRNSKFFDQKIKLLSWRMACKTKNCKQNFCPITKSVLGLIDENKSISYIFKLYNYSRTTLMSLLNEQLA